MTTVTGMVSETAPAVELKRTFRAPRRKVFAAWTSGHALADWMGPRGISCEVAILQARLGGTYRFFMRGEGQYVVGGRFTEFDPPGRLAFTWVWENGDYAGLETLVEITFAESPRGTELTLVHRRLPDDRARQQHAEGWTGSLARLAEHLGG